MNNYRFRSNLWGQLVLQYRDVVRDGRGEPIYHWRDADITHLRDYYNALTALTPRNSIRDEFESQCG